MSLNNVDIFSIEYIISDLFSNEQLRKIAKINALEDFKYILNRFFIDSVIARIKQDSSFFKKIMDDLEFKNGLMEFLLPETYEKLKVLE